MVATGSRGFMGLVMADDAGNQITIWSLVSLLAGTVISAIVSYLLQRSSFAEAKKQKEVDRIEERKALGLALFQKMIRMASTLEMLKQSLERSFARAEAQRIRGDPWQFVMPIASLPALVHFDPKELTSLMRLDMELFNLIGPFDDVHNTILETFALYRLERTALTSTLEAQIIDGNQGTTNVTEAEMRRIAPRAAALNVLIQAMVERTKLDSEDAWKLMRRLQEVLNREFKMSLNLERKPTQQ